MVELNQESNGQLHKPIEHMVHCIVTYAQRGYILHGAKTNTEPVPLIVQKGAALNIRLCASEHSYPAQQNPQSPSFERSSRSFILVGNSILPMSLTCPSSYIHSPLQDHPQHHPPVQHLHRLQCMRISKFDPGCRFPLLLPVDLLAKSLH